MSMRAVDFFDGSFDEELIGYAESEGHLSVEMEPLGTDRFLALVYRVTFRFSPMPDGEELVFRDDVSEDDMCPRKSSRWSLWLYDQVLRLADECTEDEGDELVAWGEHISMLEELSRTPIDQLYASGMFGGA